MHRKPKHCKKVIRRAVSTFLCAGGWYTPLQVYNGSGLRERTDYFTFCQQVRKLITRGIIQTRSITGQFGEPFYQQIASVETDHIDHKVNMVG